MHIGQSPIDAVLAEGETFMIDPKQMQDRRVDIIALSGIGPIEGFVTPLIALSSRNTTSNSPAGEPVGEDIGIVIATLLALRRGHPAKLRRPKNNRVFQHPSLFQVLEQGGCADGHPT